MDYPQDERYEELVSIPRCKFCGTPMDYHEFPCTDDSGNHLGDWHLLVCPECGKEFDLDDGEWVCS